MALSLLETTDLFNEGGTLLARITAACGLIAYGILSNPQSTPEQLAWAAQMQSGPASVAQSVFKGVLLTSSVQALDAGDIRAGALPIDADLMTLIETILDQFAY